MRFIPAMLVLMAGLGCSDAPEAPAPAATTAPNPKPVDESRRFPKENQTAMTLVEDHMLGKDFLPGGNLASYEQDGKKYQLFLIGMKDPETASFAMFDVKEKLTDAKFVPGFGGYFGMDGETPWFLFAKDKHLAGVVGLPKNEADLIAREFAARIQ